MFLAECAIIFKCVFYPSSFHGQRKFFAEKFNLGLNKIGNIFRNFKNFALGRNAPENQQLEDLFLFGESGKVLQAALRNRVTRSERKGPENVGPSVVTYRGPTRDEFESYYDKEKLPFTELDNKFYSPSVAQYVRDVDFSIVNYLIAVNDNNAASSVLYDEIPLPDNLRSFFGRIQTADDLRNIRKVPQEVFSCWFVDLFVFYLAVHEAGLDEGTRNILILSQQREGDFVFGIKEKMHERLRKHGLAWKDVYVAMGYDERRFYKHIGDDKRFISPQFLSDFVKAYHGLLRDRTDEIFHDADGMYDFILALVKHLHMLDRLNRDNPTGTLPNGKKEVFPVRKSDFQKSLSRLEEYIDFAENQIRVRENGLVPPTRLQYTSPSAQT